MCGDMHERTRRWAGLHPAWQVRQWSGADCDFSKSAYATKAHRQKQWAYCSDYVRLLALYEKGGVYLDTDVELLRALDPLADGALHIGYMHNCALGTAVIISPPRHPVIGGLLAFYEQLDGDCMLNNNAVFTEYFLQKVPAFTLDGRAWKGSGIYVHPKSDFEQPGLFNQGYAVHLFNQSWSNTRARNGKLRRAKPGILLAIKRMVRSLFEESRCFYLRYYLRDCYRLPVRVPALTMSFDLSGKSGD